MVESGKKTKMRSGVPQGSVLGPVICNFTLAHFTSDFFKDSFFSTNLVEKNARGKIRFLICYADDLIVKVINPHESYYVLKKLTGKLSKAN
jgi:Reverse transcriptase (RNA-dependent DNA polymerase)